MSYRNNCGIVNPIIDTKSFEKKFDKVISDGKKGIIFNLKSDDPEIKKIANLVSKFAVDYNKHKKIIIKYG